MGKKTVLKSLLRTYGKLGKDSGKLAKALETDEGFIEDLDSNKIEYFDNPNNNEDIEIEIDDDFVETDDFVEDKEELLEKE
jgi:recombinational DNA repair protein RecT